MSLGVIDVGMRLSTGGLNKGINNARSSLGGFGSAATSVGIRIKKANDSVITSFAKIGIGIQGIATLAKGIGNAITAPLALASKSEQTAISFEVLTGSAEKANAVLNDLKGFANSTPFATTEILDAGKKLIAFGNDSTKVTGELRKLGEISAGLEIPFGELADMYGKMGINGAETLIMTEDLNQMAGRGIPIQAELAKVMGVSSDKIRDMASGGKIAFKDVQQAITNMTTGSGQFAGLMDRQSKSIGGTWSTLVSTMTSKISEFTLKVAKGLGLAGGISSLTGFVDYASGFIDVLGDKFIWFIGFVKPIFSAGLAALTAYWKVLGTAIYTVFSSVTSFIGQFLPSWETFRNTTLTGLIAIEYGWTNWKAVGEFAIKTTLANIIGFAGNIKHTFTTVIPTYLAYLWDNWSHIMGELARSGQLMFGNFANNIVKIFSNIPGLIKGSVSFSELWTPLTDEMKISLKNVPEIPERVMGELEKNLRNDAENIKEGLKSGFGDFKEQRINELLPKDSATIKPIVDKPALATAAMETKNTLKDSIGEIKLADAATFGSQAARSSILKNKLSGPSGESVQKEIKNINQQQLNVSKELLKVARKSGSAEIVSI